MPLISCWTKISIDCAAAPRRGRPLAFPAARPPRSRSGHARTVLTGGHFAGNDAGATPGPRLGYKHHIQGRRPPMNPTTELVIRLAAFAGVFLAMTAWELLAPRRPWAVGRAARWPNNLGVVVVDAVAVRLLIPTAAVGVALLAAARGFGLFHW